MVFSVLFLKRVSHRSTSEYLLQRFSLRKEKIRKVVVSFFGILTRCFFFGLVKKKTLAEVLSLLDLQISHFYRKCENTIITKSHYFRNQFLLFTSERKMDGSERTRRTTELKENTGLAIRTIVCNYVGRVISAVLSRNGQLDDTELQRSSSLFSVKGKRVDDNILICLVKEKKKERIDMRESIGGHISWHLQPPFGFALS